jgi:hypothetical protein
LGRDRGQVRGERGMKDQSTLYACMKMS